MLTIEPNQESVKEWKRIYLEYKGKLIPNAKSPDNMIRYLESRYPLLKIDSEEYKQIVSDNICSNEFFKNKLKENEKPEPVS